MRVEPVPSNASNFQIISSVGLCLDSTGAKSGCTDSGLAGGKGCYPLAFVACDITDVKQQWTRGTSSGDNSFSPFVSVANAGCLDIYGATGPEVGIYRCQGHAVQQNWEHDAQNARISTSADQCLSDGDGNPGVSDTREIHVYATAPSVELLLNGASQGFQSGLQLGTRGGPSWAQFAGLKFTAGNLTAVAMDASNKTLGVHTVLTSDRPAKLVLTVDVPSAQTGTGTALLLDGQDVGLLRAEIVDARGIFCALASGVNITFKVVQGPGAVVGVHSGDPKSHEPNQASYHTSYNGLVRGIIRVTSNAAVPTGLRHEIDADGVRDVSSTGPIVVEASAPGLSSAVISIATSTDLAKDGVLAVAERFGNAVLTGFV